MQNSIASCEGRNKQEIDKLTKQEECQANQIIKTLEIEFHSKRASLRRQNQEMLNSVQCTRKARKCSSKSYSCFKFTKFTWLYWSTFKSRRKIYIFKRKIELEKHFSDFIQNRNLPSVLRMLINSQRRYLEFVRNYYHAKTDYCIKFNS